jgi:hypothetical protein
MDGRGEYRRGRFYFPAARRFAVTALYFRLPPAMALEAHIVTHTHWDREWYHPVERFRQRLVALVDELLDDPPAGDESFLLDGQAIVLEDYLDVRPDRADALGHLLRAGKLEAGPWYVLADELIPSGEALVRNLLTGRRSLRRFHAAPPPVLYCPDSFGHPAALPAIAAGFGMPLIILWRGYGGGRWPAGDTIRWASSGGERAVVFHLPRDGYEFGSHLPLTANESAARWSRMRAELVPRSTCGVMLVPNGADHHARQLRFRDALTLLEQAGAGDGVHRSSLRAFAQRLTERCTVQPLAEIEGELRDSYGYTWALQGTFGTRAHEKRLNASAERLLLREMEPWAALAARAGVSRRPLVDHAWKTLLSAHPHDTLCGCSIDEVAAAMELRIKSAVNQAVGVRDDSIAALIGHDPVSAREARDRWMPIAVIRNPAPRVRSGVVIIDVEEFVADVGVGPGSATPAGAGDAAGNGAAVRVAKPKIAGLGALQVLSRSVRQSRTESPRHYPDNDLVSVSRVAAWVSDAPAMGIASYAIGGAPSGARVARTSRPPVNVRPVVTDRRSLSNGILDVAVDESGAVELVETDTGRRISSLIELLDDADVGDLYTPAPRPRDVEIRFRGVRRVHRGPIRGELALDYRLIDRSGADRRGDADVTVRLVLDAGSPFLRFALAVDNRRENHRLRLAFRTDLSPADETELWADAAFGPVLRKPLSLSPAEAAVEHAPPTAPLHRYVSAFDAHRGLTLFSDGLAEYEALDQAIAVTLVRAVGELSRNDLPERPGHAGWPSPTPAAQCIGRFEANFAVMLHGRRTAAAVDAIERTADDVLNPMAGTTVRSALHLPKPVVGVELGGQGLAFSAVKESEEGDWLVLRCVNLTDEPAAGRWRLPFDPAEAQRTRLDETHINEIVTIERSLEFVAAPREIVTILVR